MNLKNDTTMKYFEAIDELFNNNIDEIIMNYIIISICDGSIKNLNKEMSDSIEFAAEDLARNFLGLLLSVEFSNYELYNVFKDNLNKIKADDKFKVYSNLVDEETLDFIDSYVKLESLANGLELDLYRCVERESVDGFSLYNAERVVSKAVSVDKLACDLAVSKTKPYIMVELSSIDVKQGMSFKNIINIHVDGTNQEFINLSNEEKENLIFNYQNLKKLQKEKHILTEFTKKTCESNLFLKMSDDYKLKKILGALKITYGLPNNDIAPINEVCFFNEPKEFDIIASVVRYAIYNLKEESLLKIMQLINGENVCGRITNNSNVYNNRIYRNNFKTREFMGLAIIDQRHFQFLSNDVNKVKSTKNIQQKIKKIIRNKP